MSTTNIRFDSKYQVDDVSGCWVWSAAISRAGYGVLRVDRKTMYAHRLSYVRFTGDIPSGCEIDHLCRNRSCVNPAHLEAVTHKTNMNRAPTAGKAGAAMQKAKTHCPSGHPYDCHNTYHSKSGRRECRLCHTLRVRTRRGVSVGHENNQSSSDN